MEALGLIDEYLQNLVEYPHGKRLLGRLKRRIMLKCISKQ